MTAVNTECILQYLRREAGAHESAVPDTELLGRYLAANDQSAFAALVGRHGAMVLAVSRSVLGNGADAEDAFQAAFLILARKAHAIRRQEGLAGWLQSVAYRVALKARASRARRRAREARAAVPLVAASVGDDLTWGELRGILHAELAGLPEHFRGPLVLCYLEGLTQDEAARRLGWTAATLKGRLQRGRDILRRRLERRGVALSAVLGATLAAQTLAASVSAALVEQTLRLVGEAAPAASAALALARGTLRPALSARRALLTAVVLAAGLLVGGVGVLSPKPAGGPTAADKVAQGPVQSTDLHGDALPEGALVRMGSLRLRHADLFDFNILPDGKTLLSAGGGVLRSWDLATGRLLRVVSLQGPSGAAPGGTLAPDGKTLAKMHSGKLVFWEVESGKEIKTLPIGKEDWSQFCFTPDGKTLLAWTWKPEVVLWDWRKGTERRIKLPPRRIGQDSTFHGCVSADGKYLAVGGGSGELLCLCDFASGRILYRLSCHASTSTFSPDNKRLVVSSMTNDKGGREAVLRVFELATGKQAAQYPLGHPYAYFTLAFAADGKTLACAFSDRSCLLDFASGRVLHRLPERPIVTAFTPNGKILVANMGHRFRLWDVATGKGIQDRPGDFGLELAAAISPDGKLLAAADWMDQSVSLWDMRHGRLLRRLPLKQGSQRRYVRNLAFSADGKSVVAAQMEGFLQWWEAATGKEQRTLQLIDPDRRSAIKDWIYFYQLCVSPDGKRLSTLEQLVAGKETTRLALWDTASGKNISQHSLPPKVRNCAWLDRGEVALPLKDGLKLMQTETGAERLRIAGTAPGGPLAASADGRLLAVRRAGGKAVGVWERASGKEVATVATGPVAHLALTPDNRHLVGAHEKLLRVWDLATGKECRRWLLSEAVTRLLLTADGQRAFTALADGTALVWDLAPALRSRLKAEKPDEAKLGAWWADLAGDNAARAYAAVWGLSERPEAAVALLRRNLKPTPDGELKEMRRHVADLDSPRFTTREQAFERLGKLGAAAESVLRHALEKKPSLEARRRIQLLLEKLNQRPPSSETLRILRSLEVLEHTRARGRALLQELARGTEDAQLTRAARASLRRVNRQGP